MGIETYIDQEDCRILREEDNWGCDWWPDIEGDARPDGVGDLSKVVLIDCEGDIVFQTASELKNETIWLILDQMNESYGLGVESGKNQKAREIRKALSIEGQY